MARTVSRPSNARHDTRAGAIWHLAALTAPGVILAFILWRIGGPPTLPDRSGLDALPRLLGGTSVSEPQLIGIGTGFAWLLLTYLAAATALRCGLVAAMQVTGGARWARTGLRLTHLVTIPALRRAVDGSVAGVLLLSSTLALPARVTAAPGDAAAVSEYVPETQEPRPDGGGLAAGEQQAPAAIRYAVQPGDSLWEIARRFYGDGTRYVEIFQANPSPVGSGDRPFTDPRRIEPGWVLQIPLPAHDLVVEGAAAYRVAAGDDLWSIAARFLGDGFRWTEIFEVNRGREMPDGLQFTDPARIEPGWLLELPLPVQREPVSPITPPLTASPTPAPATPGLDHAPVVTPTAVTTAAPGATARTDVPAGPAPEWHWPSVPREALVTVAGFVLLGGAAVFVHRLRRTGLIRIPSAGTAAESAVGDANRVTAAVNALSGAVADLGIPGTVVTAHETRRHITCSLAGPPDLATAIKRQRRELMRRLGCEVSISGRPDVVEVTLVGFHRLAGAVVAADRRAHLLVPVGADDYGIVYADLSAAGAIGLATDERERRRLLRAWVATLVTTHEPDRLSIRADAAAASLLGDLVEAPHFAGVGALPSTDALLEELEYLVETRQSSTDSPRTPLLAVIAGVPEQVEMLDELKRSGPAVGLFVVICTERAEPRRFPWAVEAQALREPDASDRIGTLVLRIPGRDERRLEPVHVRLDRSPRWQTPIPSSAQSPTAPEPGPPALSALGTGGDVPVGGEVADADVAAADADVVAAATDDHSRLPAAADEAIAEAGGGAPDEDPGWRARFSEAPPPDPTEGLDTAPRPAGSTVSAARMRPAPRTTAPVAGEAAPAADDGTPDAAPDDRGTRQLAMFGSAAPGEPDVEEDAVTSPPFAIRCFGEFEVEVTGTPITKWRYHKVPELLAFMVGHGARVSRERIGEALWPDILWDEHLAHSLSNIAASLRRTLRRELGRSDLQILRYTRQGRYELDHQLFAIDLDDFEGALRRAASAPHEEALAAYDRAFAVYRGEFLAGLNFAWADPYRIEYRRRLVEAALRAAGIADRDGDSERAIQYFRLALQHEPTDEAACRGLMRALAASGDINSARKAYRVLTEAIQQELGDPRAAPDPETRTLLGALVEASQSA